MLALLPGLKCLEPLSLKKRQLLIVTATEVLPITQMSILLLLLGRICIYSFLPLTEYDAKATSSQTGEPSPSQLSGN